MKNLMVYAGKLSEEDKVMLKIQIDNSLDLGWRKEDIVFASDFTYRYRGITTIKIPPWISYVRDFKANKIAIVLYLIKQGEIIPNELYWCHDLDAFELNRIMEEEIDLGGKDLGLVHYFYKQQWTLSNFFFKSGCGYVISFIDFMTIMKPWKTRNNEKILTWLIKHKRIDEDDYKKLNVTYNITKRCLQTVYREATKPIKVLHFRPSDKDELMKESALDMFMYGKNSLGFPLMDKRLISIFNKHGIR